MYLLINLNKILLPVIKTHTIYYLKDRKCENLPRIDLHLSFIFKMYGRFITFGINIHTRMTREKTCCLYSEP